VHNSGHWTIEGAVTSQFENHVRAVCGLPLGSTELRCPAVMTNLIGSIPDRRALLALSDSHLHDYDKPARAGRKVGHVTSLGATSESAMTTARRVQAIVSGS
jgi:5-(carboxyamino)imidazole ribonucleotide synthase